MRSGLSTVVAFMCLLISGHAAAADRAVARMVSANGADLGTIEAQTVSRGVLLHLRLHGLPPGAHGLHLHTVGKCEPPSFDSAGPHFNPRRATHGFHSAGGGHEGDLPNLHVPESGAIDVEVLAVGAALTEGSLLDADGTSVVVHAGPDDYRSDPAGNSGARMACGVISASGG